VAVAIPFGMVGLVHPRSGLAARVGLSIVNSPGTIDAGYRGEIKVSLINLDPAAPIVVHRGDRVAQLLVQQVELVELVEVSSFDEAGLADTSRGDGGHGSSGGHASL
jgi:dUTP pyrophosphatase